MSLDPTATHLPILEALLKTGKIKKVLEFGCGLFSTKKFLEHGCDLLSIEMQHEEWLHKVKDELGANIILALGPMEWQKLDLDDHYDLIFVDGHGDSRPDCMMWAKDRTDIIVAHDTEHPYYQWDRADMSGFVKTEFKDYDTWTTVWHKGSGWTEMDGIGQWRI